LVKSQIPRDQENLIGIDIDCNYNDQMVIRDCSFVSLGCGISFACDWGAIEGCVFETCPGVEFAGTPITNAWPVTSPYHVGASIVFKESSTTTFDSNMQFTSGNINGHQWWISRNEFISCVVPYLSFLGKDAISMRCSRLVIYNDAMEGGAGYPIYATTGNGVTFVNPRAHGINGSYPPAAGGSGYYIQGYVLTNFVNLSYWKNVLISDVSTNYDLFTVADLSYRTNSSPFTFMRQISTTGTNTYNAPTNAYGSSAIGQMPITINGVTYFIDLKR